jgi:hypothetical protein
MKITELPVYVAFMFLLGCAQLTAMGTDPVRQPRPMIALGEVDLNRAEEYQFKIEKLNDGERFVLGLNIVSGSCLLQSSNRHVVVRVTDELGRTVINENRPLKDFKWSKGQNECIPAFGYLRGEGRSTPISQSGDVCNEPIYTGVDFGYGTQFVGRKGATYTVKIKSYGGAAPQSHPERVELALAFDGLHALKTCPN